MSEDDVWRDFMRCGVGEVAVAVSNLNKMLQNLDFSYKV